MWSINRNPTSKTVQVSHPAGTSPLFFHHLTCCLAAHLQRHHGAPPQHIVNSLFGVLPNTFPISQQLAISYAHPGTLPLLWKSLRPATHIRCFHRRPTVPSRQHRCLAESSRNYGVSPPSSLTARRPATLQAINSAPSASCRRCFSFIGVPPHFPDYMLASCRSLHQHQ